LELIEFELIGIGIGIELNKLELIEFN